MTTPGLLIDGEVEAGGSGSYPVRNPVRPAEIVFDAPAADSGQLDRAVAGARRSSPAWAALDFDERSAIVCAAAQAAGAAAGSLDLARLLTREHGKILFEAMFDTGTIGGMASAFSPLAKEAISTRVVAASLPRSEVHHEPHGVVGAILPFNWPVAVMANKVLPALLTGNTIVVKAPPTCPGAVLFTAAAMAAALPKGVLSVVNGPNATLGQALVSHPGIDMVSFTGGPRTGTAVMTAAAARTTPVVLELGGNDAAILGPDIEIDDKLADAIIGAAFPTSGQVCMAIKRLYVPEARVEEIAAALLARLTNEVVGDGLEDDVTMGPVHQAAARDRVEGMISAASQAGAVIHRPATIREEDADAGGYLVSPALVVNPPRDATIVVDEQFAPALPLLGYSNLEDAIAMANDTTFGLCASVWTEDLDLATGVARRLQAGTVFINCHGMAAMDYRAPMGGWKESGFGVELGPDGMAAFTRPKTVLTHPAG